MEEYYCKVNEAPKHENDFEHYYNATMRLRALALTPEEAKELIYCFIHESQRRYGKVNKEAPLYLKLRKIASPVLLKIKLASNHPLDRTLKKGGYYDCV